MVEFKPPSPMNTKERYLYAILERLDVVIDQNKAIMEHYEQQQSADSGSGTMTASVQNVEEKQEDVKESDAKITEAEEAEKNSEEVKKDKPKRERARKAAPKKKKDDEKTEETDTKEE